MKKLNLSLFDALQLESEINGFVNPQTKETVYKGFIKHNLPVVLKYDLFELSEKLIVEKKKVDEIRNDLIKKYGEADNEGNINVKMYDEIGEGKVKITENFLEFEKEYNELLSQNLELNYNEITRDDLKKVGDSEDNYRFLFKLVKKDVVETVPTETV